MCRSFDYFHGAARFRGGGGTPAQGPPGGGQPSGSRRRSSGGSLQSALPAIHASAPSGVPEGGRHSQADRTSDGEGSVIAMEVEIRRLAMENAELKEDLHRVQGRLEAALDLLQEYREAHGPL